MVDINVEFTIHETLACVLDTCDINNRNRMLSAYAAQKYTMQKCCDAIKSEGNNNNFSLYIADDHILNYRSLTSRNLPDQFRIIQFQTKVFPISQEDAIKRDLLIIINKEQDPNQNQIEREFRRYIDSSHPILVNRLGISCNDFSNTKFVSRQIEINFENYRMIISGTEYTVQFKKRSDDETKNFVLPPPHLTIENLYSALEGPVYKNPCFLKDCATSSFLGIASFLDCNNLSVKTVYMYDKKNETILYQRIKLEDYFKYQPFILEKEISSKKELDDEQILIKNENFNIYSKISTLLNAKLKPPQEGDTSEHLLTSESQGENYHATTIVCSSTKPMHSVKELSYLNRNINSNDNIFVFPKLDGIPAKLTFYSHHFILTNNQMSQSWKHKISPEIIHILRDYIFLAETNLYSSKYATDDKKALAIIDICNIYMSAFEKMQIIQQLRINIGHFLIPYMIFFQGEIPISCDIQTGKYFLPNKINDNNTNYNNISTLKHGNIYEVSLDDECSQDVVCILKERNDKIRPNSFKVVEVKRALNEQKIQKNQEEKEQPKRRKISKYLATTTSFLDTIT